MHVLSVKSYAQPKLYLDAHIQKVHKRENAVSCDICKSVYKPVYKSSLNVHKRTYTANKQCCDTCGVAFFTKLKLRKHHQTHRPNKHNYKLEDLKCLIENTHADIITIQETKLTSKSNTPKVPKYTTVLADRPHKSGGGLITLIILIRDNITFTPTDIPSTINTHNIELQMVKVHLNNTKYITIANVYTPPRDSTSTHYKTADKDIQYCIQHITTLPHSVFTGDVNAHSSLWHSYTDDHRGQLIAEVITTYQQKFISRYHHGVQYTVQPDIVADSPRTIIRPLAYHDHNLYTT